MKWTGPIRSKPTTLMKSVEDTIIRAPTSSSILAQQSLRRGEKDLLVTSMEEATDAQRRYGEGVSIQRPVWRRRHVCSVKVE